MNDIVDMARFIEAKSDQLNSDDLIGREITVTVTRIIGTDGDQPVSIFYDGDNDKPWKPCKTARRVLMAVWGRNGQDYVGRSLTLFRDDSVTFGGLQVGGIRIKAMSHMDEPTVVVVMKTKGKKAGIKIEPLMVAKSKPEPRKPSDTPEAWATTHIEAINRAPDLAKLDAFVGNRATRLAQLPEDLQRICQDAYDSRRIALAEGEAAPDDEDDAAD